MTVPLCTGGAMRAVGLILSIRKQGAVGTVANMEIPFAGYKQLTFT